MNRRTQKLDYADDQSEKPKLDTDQVFNSVCIIVIMISVAMIVHFVMLLLREGVVPVQH